MFIFAARSVSDYGKCNHTQAYQVLEKNAHAIKGSAANLWAKDLTRAASAMKKMSKSKKKKTWIRFWADSF
ncbi:MAG: Hpt domain-containing protein [Desulfobacter sp.]|nr:Hpt domain-containing protein [Desulfobacter sp.]